MSLALILDGVIALLLAATIGYAIVLNRKLSALRRTRSEMEALVGQFSEAAERAQSGLAEVQRAAGESGKTLEKHLGEARGLADDLAFMVDKGNGLADRLEKQISEARKQSARPGPSVVEPAWAEKKDKTGVLVERNEEPDTRAEAQQADSSPSQPAEKPEPGPHAAALATAARAARDAVSEVARKSEPTPKPERVAATGTDGRPPSVAANAPGSAAPPDGEDDAPLMQILRRVR